MPMIITRGAVSARGFGFAATQAASYTYQVAAMVPNTVTSFVVPAGVTSLTVEVIGPGGLSTRTANPPPTRVGSGGAGGAYAKSVVTVTPGDTYYLFPGQANTSGTNGLDAWGNTSNAEPSSTTTGALAKRATGATAGSATSSIGTTKYAGGSSSSYFGGGGAGGPAGAGKNGSGGGGGAGGASSTNGTAATSNNGGAGGAGPSGTGGGSGATISPQVAATSGAFGLGGGGGGAGFSEPVCSPTASYPDGVQGTAYSYFGGNYGPGGGGGAGETLYGCYIYPRGAGGKPGGFGAGNGSGSSAVGGDGLVVVSFTSSASATGWASVQNANKDYNTRDNRSPISTLSVAGVDSSGNIYTVGMIRLNTSTNDNRSFLIQKFSSKGVFQWQRTLTPASTINSTVINAGPVGLTDTSGNTYIMGSNGGSLSYIAKYNSSGTIQWQKIVSYGTAYTTPCSMCFDSSGNIWAAGVTQIDVGCGYGQQFWVWKFDTSGSKLASYQRDIAIGDSTYRLQNINIQVGSSGNVYIGFGVANLSCTYSFTSTLIKYNSTLSSVSWSKGSSAGGDYYQASNSFGLQLDSSENVYWYFAPQGLLAISLAKFNSSGTFQWGYNQTITTTQSTGVWGSPLNQNFSQDSSGNSYIGFIPTGTYSYANITKVNSSGVAQWATQFYPTGNYRSTSYYQGSVPFYVNGSSLVFTSGSWYNDLVSIPTSGVAAGTYAPYAFATETASTNSSNYANGSAYFVGAFSTTSISFNTGTATDAAGPMTSSFTTYITS